MMFPFRFLQTKEGMNDGNKKRKMILIKKSEKVKQTPLSQYLKDFIVKIL